MQRFPAVSGQFYPDNPRILKGQIESFLAAAPEPVDAIGIVSPHAGYVYSGAIAGAVIGSTRIPDTVIVMGPNHQGLGERAAIFIEGSWQTPLGSCPIASDLASRLLDACPLLAPDELAHRYEHSLEVQVPFLLACNPDVSLVPICLGHLPLDRLLELGEAVAGVLGSMEKRPLLLASSDMSHYVSARTARTQDMLAIERVLDLDPEGLYRVVRDNRISMCGVLPTVVMLAAARQLGASSADLVRYGHSGDVTGDDTEVVGYAGIRVR